MSRVDGPEGLTGRFGGRRQRPSWREAAVIAELSRDLFRRDLAVLLPHARLEYDLDAEPPELALQSDAPEVLLYEGPRWKGQADAVEMDVFGVRHRVSGLLGPQDVRLLRAMGVVLTSRFHDLFRPPDPTRLELYRATNEDHYIAACIDPEPYRVGNRAPNRIVGTILALRMAALSTYENRRVATGALLVGSAPDPFHDLAPAAPDALTYGLELSGLKSIHRLCDGRRTVYLVDGQAKLSGIVDVSRFASRVPGDDAGLPCSRWYQHHARATLVGGHVCLVLTPNQEIKLFAEGVEAFAFAHGRWRMRDVSGKFAAWQNAVRAPEVGRALFQAGLNLSESRQGGLFVVARDAAAASGKLIARHDLLGQSPSPSTSAEGPTASPLSQGDALAKRALHYLARGKSAIELDPPVLEALASLDGALITDRNGRLLAFGAILRHEAADLAGMAAVEGARTTAAVAASMFGPVLKVSEDGQLSCFLDGKRVWEL